MASDKLSSEMVTKDKRAEHIKKLNEIDAVRSTFGQYGFPRLSA